MFLSNVFIGFEKVHVISFFFIAIASLNEKNKQNKYNSSEFFIDLYTSSLHTLVKNVNIYIQCIAPHISAFMLTQHAVFYHYKNGFIIKPDKTKSI